MRCNQPQVMDPELYRALNSILDLDPRIERASIIWWLHDPGNPAVVVRFTGGALWSTRFDPEAQRLLAAEVAVESSELWRKLRDMGDALVTEAKTATWGAYRTNWTYVVARSDVDLR